MSLMCIVESIDWFWIDYTVENIALCMIFRFRIVWNKHNKRFTKRDEPNHDSVQGMEKQNYPYRNIW